MGNNMKKCILMLVLLFALSVPVSASTIDTGPVYDGVPDSAREFLPGGEDLPDSLGQLALRVLQALQPSLTQAVGTCCGILSTVLLCSVFSEQKLSGQDGAAELVGCIGITGLLLSRSGSLLGLCKSTIGELCEYGKLLLPVMTSAMAASGAPSTSAALYLGTAAFDSLLLRISNSLLLPLLQGQFVLAFANGTVGGDLLQRLRDMVQWVVTWGLKGLLYIFTGYMTLTGVLNGTADAAALKATKATLTTAVPVVGKIVANASDAVVAGAAAVKAAAGGYGLLALLAICAGPFCQIGGQYLMLKLTAALCGITGNKRLTQLVTDYAAVMGMMLAMIGAGCLMLLISLICFMKGVAGA